MAVEKLKKHFDFMELKDTPFKSFTRHLVLQMKPNTLGNTRFGYTVSKKISKLATDRNRLRRQMRNIVRLHPQISNLYPSHDFVLIARKSALDCTYQELAKDFDYLLTHIQEKDSNEG